MKITFNPFCTSLSFSGHTASFFYSSHLTPLHSHNTLQLILGMKGEFKFRTAQTNWATFNGVIIKENVVHQLNTNQSLQLIIYIDAYSAVAQQFKDSYLINSDFCSVSVVFTPLEEVLIYQNLAKHDPGSIKLLSQLVIGNILDDSKRAVNDKRIAQLLDMVKQTPPADLSIEALASKVFVSPSRLRMQFKQLLGVSLHQYIIKHKLLSAITSIINGVAIQDAAYRCGFNDGSHLNKMMVKILGITPSMFLKENQKFSVIADNNSFQLKTKSANHSTTIMLPNSPPVYSINE